MRQKILAMVMMLLIILMTLSPLINAQTDAFTKVGEGVWQIEEDNFIKLANHIKDLREDNVKLKSEKKALEKILKEERLEYEKRIQQEREKAEEVIVAKNETIRTKDSLIYELEQQIINYEEKEESEKTGDFLNSIGHGLTGAGIASVLLMLTIMLN